MIGLVSLRWVLTAAFGFTSVYHFARCLRPVILPEPIGEHWISEFLHLTMGVSMTAMIWPWGSRVPAWAWAVVFTLSTGWFVARALWTTGRRAVLGFFATVMATMAWMGVSMPAQASSHTDMAGMSGMTMTTGPTAWISAILGAYLVLAAFWWFRRGLRLGSVATGVRPLSWSSICHGLMSIGMGLALLTMI